MELMIVEPGNSDRDVGLLRTVPTIVIAYICSAHLQILVFPIANAYLYRDLFARFKTIQRK